MTDFLGTNVWVFCVVEHEGGKRTQKEVFMEKINTARSELCLHCICGGLAGALVPSELCLPPLTPPLHISDLLVVTAVEGTHGCFLSIMSSVQTGLGACCPASSLQVSVCCLLSFPLVGYLVLPQMPLRCLVHANRSLMYGPIQSAQKTSDPFA